MCETGMMSRRVASALLATVVGFAAMTGRSAAEEKPDAGTTLYRRYCASCHGTAGRGDGPVAEALATRPKDLTALSYDVPTLMRAIDGRRTIRAHGPSEMPVWGYIFEESSVGEPHRLRTVLHELRVLAEHTRDLQQRR
jgi:mono/diheme cytochrome c family protein